MKKEPKLAIWGKTPPNPRLKLTAKAPSRIVVPGFDVSQL
jgi:hypothetical protein